MRRGALPALPLLLLVIAARASAEEVSDKDIRRSVARLFVTQRYPNYVRPWARMDAQSVCGTAVVIEGQRLLTNAHLVMYASQVYVQPYQSSERLPAKVAGLAPRVDLAIVEVADRGFFAGRAPLAMSAELPRLRAPVSVYGYPVGGNDMAITKGAVTRIEYSGSSLRVDVDAEIGPGSSGGPAIVHGKMTGIVSGWAQEGQNVARVLPTEEIAAFLEDIGDGKYDGKLQMWELMQPLENHALRGKLGLERTLTGVLVRDSLRSPDPDFPLKKGDVITRIGAHEIDNRGMVRVRENLRLFFAYLVPKVTRGSTVPLTIVRAGATREIALPVSSLPGNLLIRPLDGEAPAYFVWGPLAFSPVTSELVNTLSPYLSEDWTAQASPLVRRRFGYVAFEGEELVVITAMFPHRISKGYDSPVGRVVGTVNGTAIRNLRHLVETLRDARAKYVEFELAGRCSELLVFDRQEALDSMEEILGDNGIRRQASPDLLRVWQNAAAKP